MNVDINPFMFRAYDIRGRAVSSPNEKADLNVDVVEIIGKGVGTFICEQGGTEIAVGRDNRESSEAFKDALIRGILSSGCNVVDIGLSTSPLLYFSVYAQNHDGGVEITGSHLKPQFNGFKLVGKKAYPIASSEIERIRDIIFKENFKTGDGSLSTRDFSSQYVNEIVKRIKLERPLKVVVDTGNGVPGLLAPKTLREIGCEVVELFTDLDGTFPNHLPDPEKEANVKDLKLKVVEEGADIGLAFDGDGDRVGIVDETGQKKNSDDLLILLAREYLDRFPGEKVLFDVKSSQNVIEEIKKHGGIPVLYKTGHSLIKIKMREDDIGLGAEYSGHTFLHRDYYPFDDGLFTACKVLEIISKKQFPLSEHWKDLPKLYATPLVELPCSDKEKFNVVAKVAEKYKETHEVVTVDGARVYIDDGWFIIRASNTSANLTIRFEAESKQTLEAIIKNFLNTLKEFSSVDLDPLLELDVSIL